jgi:ankyrin repeat protein
MRVISFFIRLARIAAVIFVVLLIGIGGWYLFSSEKKISYNAQYGNLSEVRALLKNNPNLVFSKGFLNLDKTPLHWAAQEGNKEMTELLLANRADVNARDFNDWTPLHWAAQKGHKDEAELLLLNKADVDARAKNGWTPLLLASQRGHKDVVELLLVNKADVNAKNKWGRTPLREAEFQGHESIADFLRRHGGSD